MTDAKEIKRDLESPDPEVRRRATSVIPSLPSAEGTAFIIRALGDSDWRVRKEAGQIALLLGPSELLIEQLINLLFPGENVGLRNAAVETLAAFGRSGVPAVVRALPRLDADGKKLAAEILGRAQDPSALGALEGLLGDPDPNVRVAAVEAIGDLGGLAVDAASSILLRSLDSGEIHVRLAALEGLNRLGVVVPWPKLAPLVSHRILRGAALAAASRAGRAEAANVLAEALEDDSPTMFRLALLGLAELALSAEISRHQWSEAIPELGPKAIGRLLEAIAPDATDEAARRAALVVAAVVGQTAAIDLAIDALTDDSASREADAALAIFGEAALQPILARVAKGEPGQRAAAIARLGGLYDSGSQDSIRAALRGAVDDPSPEVSSAALNALGQLGRPEDIALVFAAVVAKTLSAHTSAQNSLAALARRYPEDARITARVARRDRGSYAATSVIIGALGGNVLGSVADDVLFLAGGLTSPDPKTRLTAVEAVADVGSDLGMESLQFALADEEREIQLSAVRALGRLRMNDGRPAGGERLVEILRTSSDSELVATAARALGNAQDPLARESLRPLALSSSPLVAVAAVETLGKLVDPDRVEPLFEATHHAHPEVVKAALLAMEGVRDSRALQHFGRVLSHDAWDVRRLAADCLGRFGGDLAATLLRDRLAGEDEPLVREAIGRALGAIDAPQTVRRPATIAPPKADS